MNSEVNWMQQGWECPKCGAVMSPTTSCCVNCKGSNSFQSSLSGQSRYEDEEDWRPTLQQQFDKLIEHERKKIGDNISPLGGDR